MTSDLERIDELHRADMNASKAGDYRTLRTLMSDDAVVLPPGGRMIRGREALDASFGAMASHTPSSEVLEYGFDWHEVEICGDYAFEWGYIVGKERNLDDGTISAEKHHVMRILRRQPESLVEGTPHDLEHRCAVAIRDRARPPNVHHHS